MRLGWKLEPGTFTCSVQGMPYGKDTWKLAHEGVCPVERGHTSLGGLGLGGWWVHRLGAFERQEGGLGAAQRRSERITLICPEFGHETN